MKHYIITNRYVENEKIQVDGKELATEKLRFGVIESEGNLQSFKGDPNDVIKLYRHEDKDDSAISSISTTDTGSAKFFGELYQAMCAQNGGDTLVFIHGYNCDLKGAVQLLGVLGQRYINPSSPIKQLVLFTWPAMSSLLKYRDDIQDSLDSGRALARAFFKLNAFYQAFFKRQTNDNQSTSSPLNPVCNRKIHLLAHSAGNRVLQAAMQVILASPEYKVGQIFDQVILAAADVDNFALETDQSMSHLCALSQRVHTYNHKKDLALEISQTTKNPFPRLGKNGVRNNNQIPQNTIMVDVTGVKEDLESNLINDAISHWYYYTSTKVINDITQVLWGTHSMDILASRDRKPYGNAQNLYYIS